MSYQKTAYNQKKVEERKVTLFRTIDFFYMKSHVAENFYKDSCAVAFALSNETFPRKKWTKNDEFIRSILKR
jgi:hypothetical protein